jgi:hypothetical protein
LTSPHLVFACCDAPSEDKALGSAFTDPRVVADLKQIHAGVAVALSDFGANRARLVHQLNQAGIPVTCWFVLPEQQGYFLNTANASEAEVRFAALKQWTAAQDLRWQGIVLDIEPSLQEFSALKNGGRWGLFANLFRRGLNAQQVTRANQTYAALIAKMQSDGYFVETSQMPFIVAERRAHTTLLERLLGIVNVRGNVEVLMLYTSPVPSIDSAMVWVLGPEAQAIAVGSTIGEGALDWTQFSRDLIVASHFANLVGIYDLEGSVRQGFLPRLKTMDWGQSVTIPAAAVRKAALLHSLAPSVLWTVSRLPYLAAIVLLADVWLIWARTRRRSFERGM